MGTDEAATKAPHLSNRGARILTSYGSSVKPSDSPLRDAYDPEHNPNGYINLNAAQNTLQHAELLAFLKERFDLSQVDFTFGDDLSGSARLLRGLTAFVNRNFNPTKPVSEDDIVVGAGCGPLTEQLFQYLADPGEGMLLPVPYFAGYIGDLTVRNGIVPVPISVSMEEHFSTSNMPAFEAALKNAEGAGTPIRGLILCNPHNPLGRCYPREALLQYGRFCEQHDLHLVCDEIFAFSTFHCPDLPEQAPFVSALSIDWAKEAGCNPARVHILYGFSKDFNANGLRGGALISPYNPDLLAAVRATSHYIKMSGATSVLWSLILESDAFWSSFVKENQRRLKAAYTYATTWLKFQQIPYFPACAGHYVAVDLRRFFPRVDVEGKAIPEDDDTARDQELNKLLMKHKVMLGASSSFGFPQKGWFRLCYTMKPEKILVAFRRLEKAYGLQEWKGVAPE